jgi:hypothetical protein
MAPAEAALSPKYVDKVRTRTGAKELLAAVAEQAAH